MLEGDDDAVSLLQEKEIDNLAGKMQFFCYYLSVKVGWGKPRYKNEKDCFKPYCYPPVLGISKKEPHRFGNTLQGYLQNKSG